MADLAARGLQAAQTKNQARLDKLQTQTPPPAESGIYQGFQANAPSGSRHTVLLDDGSTVQGEFISPSAPPSNTKVAAYRSGNGSYLFDCL